MIDLTMQPVTLRSCYQRIIDSRLEHQLQVHWGRHDGKTVFAYIDAVCNCGAEILVFKPEEDRLRELNAAYARHVESLL